MEVQMKRKGIRILDKINNFVIVDFPDILEAVPNGDRFYWAILYLYASGHLGEGQSLPVLEEEIKHSQMGFLITWEELNYFAKKISDLIDITVIGCKNKSMIKRYNSDKEMYETCDFVIEMIDSGYWEIFSKNKRFLNILSKKYNNIEIITTDVKNE